MKLVRYGNPGFERRGVIDANGSLRDVHDITNDDPGVFLDQDSVETLRRLDLSILPKVDEGIRLGSCVAVPTNFIAVGLNYADHAAESGMPIPVEPILFSKAPNCIVGPNDDVVIPRGSLKTDWEIELAFVIGKRAFNVAENEAMSHVAGFCICNDVSERSWQIEGTGQWLKGKSAPTFGPLGPWLVTPDEVKNVDNLQMELRVDGKVMQTGSTATMIFKVPYLLSYISKFMELLPGDVVTTGTPPGVGMGKKPPIYLEAGQLMDLSIENLGVQRQAVKAQG
ncbi:fumarylacetoacetate hydrolase family protein [Mesorhizobium sp. SB112]|uniref:fumarylacetoacetate hydrolase family protein n=1 Tax=Mesorhizobium sp. SB112 TaxID=3151853 RepID=UPI003262F368